MALTETKQEILLLTSLSIRSQIVADWKKRVHEDPTINPLRAMSLLYYDIVEAFRENKINPDEYPTNFTIGSLNPRRFAIKRDDGPDPLESEFSDLSKELTINPHSPDYQNRLKATRLEIEETAWDDSDSPVYTSYDPWARGTEETRAGYLEELKKLGFDNVSVGQTFLCAGGMDGIVRSARTLHHLLLKKKDISWQLSNVIEYASQNLPQRQITLIAQALLGNFSINNKVKMGFPTPGFMMAANASASEGLDVVKIKTTEENDFFPTAGQIQETLSNQRLDVLMLTPFGNPSTTTWAPEKLEEFLKASLKKQPEIKFVFDMAYINLVSPDTAKAVVGAIYQSGASSHSVLVFSRSKEWGQPRLRSGLILALDSEINVALNNDTLGSVASQPYDVDFHDRTLHVYFQKHPEVLEKYRKLLRQRQHILLNSLIIISEAEIAKDGQPLFNLDYLNRIVIPNGSLNQPLDKNSIVADVPLYLYVKLKDGLTAWDLAEKYGIIAIPGTAFGGDENMVRFSIGTLSSSDIKGVIKNIN